MPASGDVVCWSCRQVTPSSRATCMFCGHPLAAAPPQGYAPPAYPVPLAAGSPSMMGSAAAGARAIAFFIDFFIVAALYTPVLVIMPSILGTNLYQWNGMVGGILNLLLPLSLFWFYKSALEMSWGATVGKRLLGLHVVNRDMSEISATQALTRNADLLVWGFTFGIMALASWQMIRTKGASLGDMFAHTFVVPK